MIRRFLSYYKEHIALFTADMFAAVAVAACGLFYPTVARKIINEYVYDDTPRRLIVWAFVLLGIYLFKALCNYFIGYYGHVIGIRIQASMRRDLFRKFESLPFSYFDKNKTGDLLSRLVGDLFDVSELVHHGPENLLLSVLMLVGSFVILVRINLTLTLIMFAVIPFIVVFTLLSRTAMHKAMKASRAQIAAVNASAETSISGVRETKSYVAEDFELEKFDRENALFVKHRKSAMFALGIFDSGMQLLSDILYLVVIAIGGLFLFYGRIDAGDFAAFVLYISMFLNPIHRFVSLFEQLQEGMTGFSRFCEVMDTPDEDDKGTTELSDVRGDICFEDVSFRYEGDETDEERPVLTHMNLSVKAGKTLALVGPSGGGKTTVCHLIPRFYNVNEGKITLDGVDVQDIKLSSLRSAVGIVSQNIFLFDGTIRENIAYGTKDATDEQIVEAARKANIHEFVTTLEKGYDTQVGERGIRLSGGQKQRVAIARIFLKNPKLLILDEATSALDNATEMQIQASLEELSRGRTVIVVAHRLSTVKNADEIVVLDKTGIVEQGTHADLLARNGAYKKLYDYQFSGRNEAVNATF